MRAVSGDMVLPSRGRQNLVATLAKMVGGGAGDFRIAADD
jgi:hypothetical protein